jgi:hypothetical protein
VPSPVNRRKCRASTYISNDAYGTPLGAVIGANNVTDKSQGTRIPARLGDTNPSQGLPVRLPPQMPFAQAMRAFAARGCVTHPLALSPIPVEVRVPQSHERGCPLTVSPFQLSGPAVFLSGRAIWQPPYQGASGKRGIPEGSAQARRESAAAGRRSDSLPCIVPVRSNFPVARPVR